MKLAFNGKKERENAMKYEHISRKEVMETIDFYKRNPDINSPTIRIMGRTTEEFIGNLNKRSQKNKNGRLEKSLVVYRENKDLLTKESIEVINKLLGDKKIRDKVRIVHDGSYLVNRIWNYVDTECGKVNICPEFWAYRIDVPSSEFDRLSLKKKIDWLYNHFDVIYIQINLVKSRQDIIEEIEYQTMQDELEHYYDCDYDY